MGLRSKTGNPGPSDLKIITGIFGAGRGPAQAANAKVERASALQIVTLHEGSTHNAQKTRVMAKAIADFAWNCFNLPDDMKKSEQAALVAALEKAGFKSLSTDDFINDTSTDPHIMALNTIGVAMARLKDHGDVGDLITHRLSYIGTSGIHHEPPPPYHNH